jgi:hypothetical protein
MRFFLAHGCGKRIAFAHFLLARGCGKKGFQIAYAQATRSADKTTLA